MVLLSGAASAEPENGIYSVGEVKAAILSLDGKNVQVRGWLIGCHGGFDCRIATSPNDRDGPYLTIDLLKSFEPQLSLASGQEIILKAKVTKECTVNICTDRGPDLVPIRVMKIIDGA